MTETLANGRYEVLRRLAVGGMGEVLLAEFAGDDELSAGLLVVKRILSNAPGQAPAASQVQMLQEEGRLGLRLFHSNLVETFRFEPDDDAPILVMELLAGRSMAQVLGQAKKSRAPVPIDVALAILRGSACGLHFAHTLTAADGSPLGLVHRDVSPANIFVTFDGSVKVIDFGVAKSEDSEIKTATGILKGKLGYMSPEQSLGAAKLTPQADVWSLGVFFWEMLLAERLFSSPNPTATLLQITQKDIPKPSSIRADIPPAVDAICMGMLSRPMESRFQDCAELARAIDALPRGGGVSGVDLGGFLAERYPDEAAAGADEAARCARPRRRTPMPTGLTEGSARGAEAEDDDLATAVLPANIREELLRGVAAAAPAPAPVVDPTYDDIDEDAATVRVTADVLAEVRAMGKASEPARPTPSQLVDDDDEDDIATRPVDADMLAKLRNAPRPASLGRSPTPMPQRAPGRTPPPPPGASAPSGRSGPTPAAPPPPRGGAVDPVSITTMPSQMGDLSTQPTSPPVMRDPPPKVATPAPSMLNRPPTGEVRPAREPMVSLDPPMAPMGQGARTPSRRFDPPQGISPAPQPNRQPPFPSPPSPPPAPSSSTTGPVAPLGRSLQVTPSGGPPGAPPPRMATAVPSAPVPVATPSRRMSASTASAAGSWVSVAVATFGVLVVVMGVVFSFVMPSSPPRLAHVYADLGGHDVIVSDISAIPTGRPHRQIDLSKPVLNKPGSAEMEMVAPDVLQARLQASGVWARLALPSTTKATVAAMLPLLIVGLGLLALAVGVPALLIRGGMGRLAVQGLGVVGVIAAVVAGLQFGALSWPGRVAYDATPSMPWLPPPG